MIEFARYEADGAVTAGPIEGAPFFSGITPASRFWPLIEEWAAEGHTIPPYVPPEPLQVRGVLSLCCLANLQISGFDAAGIETAVGLNAAFMIDVGKVWVFFEKPMHSMAYSWNVNSSMGQANVTSRDLECIEISISQNDVPVEVTELAIQIFKVQFNGE